MDTIFAPATARGKAGVAVVRVSGPRAWDAAGALCGSLPAPRRAGRRSLRFDGELLDDALVLLFEPGRSFTGEAVAELQLHGSPAVVEAVLQALASFEGLRPAEAGEFTRRAMENGRLDLAQVEGLADLIAAETEGQRRQAMRVLAGVVGEQAEGWRRRLVRAAALLEATIDFVDEDVPVDVRPEVSALLRGVQEDLAAEIAGSFVAERLRDGFEVAVIGRPNVGKSTLVNMLVGRGVSLVSEHEGTTRDVIEARLDLDGLPVTLLDTAGLREAEDPVERMGVARARERAEAADLRVFLIDPGAEPYLLEPAADDIVIVGKGDLHPGVAGAVSGLTGDGAADLMRRISGILQRRAAGAGAIAHARQRHALERVGEALGSALGRIDDALFVELCASDLRRALHALDALVGRVDAEHILDEVFASFCIGK